jgi:protein-S-isoprenylcysteine O-methyltransferase Ste14
MHCDAERNGKGKSVTKICLTLNKIMDNQLYIVLVIVCILTHIIRTVYEIFKHNKILESSKFSFVIIFTNMTVLWISWFMLCGLDNNRVDIPLFAKYAGLLLILSGVIIFLTALFTIKTLESYKGDLIKHGIYSKLRHPMYTGFILWLLGAPIFYGALYSFMLSVVFIANVLYWRYLEEKELEKRFPVYSDYKKTTLF